MQFLDGVNIPRPTPLTTTSGETFTVFILLFVSDHLEKKLLSFPVLESRSDRKHYPGIMWMKVSVPLDGELAWSRTGLQDDLIREETSRKGKGGTVGVVPHLTFVTRVLGAAAFSSVKPVTSLRAQAQALRSHKTGSHLFQPRISSKGQWPVFYLVCPGSANQTELLGVLSFPFLICRLHSQC